VGGEKPVPERLIPGQSAPPPAVIPAQAGIQCDPSAPHRRREIPWSPANTEMPSQGYPANPRNRSLNPLSSHVAARSAAEPQSGTMSGTSPSGASVTIVAIRL
jgi:hypothetical protein